MRSIAHLSRIALTIGSHGFGPLVMELGVQELIRLLPLIDRWGQPRARTIGKRVRMLFQELGPTFQKFGQVLSTQGDLLPDEMIAELQKLQYESPPMSPKELKKILKKNFPKLKDVFSEFNEKPAGVASIGQVHRGKLVDGTPVAIKIQRPGVSEIMKKDLESLEWIATTVLQAKPEWKRFNILGILQLFKRSLLSELDFKSEAQNTLRLRKLASAKGILVPLPFEKLSHQQILVMEWVDGSPLTTLLEKAPSPLSKKVAHQILDLILHQVFDQGVFHGDPHPGNFILTPDDKLAMIDAGLIGTLTNQHRKALVRSLRAVLQGDATKMSTALISMSSFAGSKKVPALVNQLAPELEKIFRDLKQTGALEKTLQKVFRAAARLDVLVDVEYVLMLKALLTVESLCRQLDPEIRVLAVAKPIVLKGLLGWTNPFRFLIGKN